jgi:hypothetical protein
VSLAALAAASCSEGNRNATGAESMPTSAVSEAEAKERLQQVMLTAPDVGDGYRKEIDRPITNAQAAQARPDTANAERQYEAWGQVLSHNVQFASENLRAVLNTSTHARVIHTATVFNDAGGAETAMVYLRALPVELLEQILTSDGGATQISDTQVTRGLDFPFKGDEIYVLRTSGKAAISGRLTISFIADTVFVRAGNVNGAITAVALGATPDRAALERLVDRFLEKVRAS